MKREFITAYKDISIYYDSYTGMFYIEDSQIHIEFPSEQEAMEYIDEQVGL